MQQPLIVLPKRVFLSLDLRSLATIHKVIGKDYIV